MGFHTGNSNSARTAMERESEKKKTNLKLMSIQIQAIRYYVVM